MTEYKITEGSATNSFSSYSNVLASAIFASTLLGQALPNPDVPRHQNATRAWSLAQTSTQQSFHDTPVMQAAIEYKLVDALQHVYEDFATQQQDLDPEIKEVLYPNLWSLYS